MAYRDGGDFVSGNGGYIAVIDKANGRTRWFNISKWQLNMENVNANVSCSGSNGIITYRKVGQTAHWIIEMPWDYIMNPDEIVDNDKGFYVYAELSDRGNFSDGIMRAYECENVLLEKFELLVPADCNDVVRLKIYAVSNDATHATTRANPEPVPE